MKRASRATALALAVGLAVVGSVPAAAYPRPGRTEVVSRRDDGTVGSAYLAPSISADGRYVAFWSSGGLVPEANGGGFEVYVRDRVAGTIEWASPGPGGIDLYQGNISDLAISADGRSVAFGTLSPMVPGDTNAQLDIFVRDLVADTTELVSLQPNGAQFPGSSGRPTISADGRYVAFDDNLGLGQPQQVYVRDRVAGTTQPVSVGNDGSALPGSSSWPSISADGRYVAFQNVVPAYACAPYVCGPPIQVFLRDRQAGTTVLVSRGSSGQGTAGDSLFPSLSADGRYVAFMSNAPDLVPRDTNTGYDVFVFDRVSGTTERASVTSTGAQSAGSAGPTPACVGATIGVNPQLPPQVVYFSSISPDGRYVGFVSLADDFVSGDTNGCYDTFVHDRLTRTTERVSVTSEGGQAVRAGYFIPAFTPGGRYVAFLEFSDLDPVDMNRTTDTYLRDRGPEAGVGGVTASSAESAVSVDGWATFSGSVASTATDATGDAGPAAAALGAELTGASVVYRPEPEDLLVRLAASIPRAPQPVVYGLRLGVGGTQYEARIGASGAALYRCAPSCTQVASLAGSVATTGNEVLLSIPLSAISAQEGATLSGLAAFAGAGDGSVPAQTLDDVPLPNALVPTTAVWLGIAPAGTAEEDVQFATPASLSGGTFSGSLDSSSLPPGDYDVWARGCLGQECGAASARLVVGEG